MKKVFILICFLLPAVWAYAVDLGREGNVYKISERDILEVIKERAAGVDWKAMSDNASKELRDKIGKVDKSLPKASDNSTYYIDLTTELDHDIYIRDEMGNPKILYPKGYRFNVLDYTQLKGRYVFFDATRPEEMKWFKDKFASDLSVMPIIAKGSVLKISKEIKRETYILDDLLISKFQIKATPTLIYQEDNKLRADEFYLEAGNHEQTK